MAEVNFKSVDASIEFEDQTIAARPTEETGPDLMALRAALEPVLNQMLEDRLSQYMRIRG